MAATVARLEAYLSANTRDFDQAVDRSHHRFSTAGKAIGKVAAGVGLAIGAGLGIAAKIGFDEFKENQLVMAQTEAVLKSTGKAARVTAKHVDELASSISDYSGMDDEAIQSGENMLLTFTQIQNRAGKMNDIFDQTTKVTADLSVAMGIDMSKAALQVGKALNDPERGMSRLQRIGVAFTQGQKDAVAALMKTGDTAGAQKIILAELTKEFGGSAEAAGKTLPGQLQILKENFANVAGEIVGRFVPVLVKFATFVGPLVLKAMDAIGKLIDQFVAPAFKRIGDVASQNWPKIQEVASRVFGWIRSNVFPIVIALKNIWVEAVQRIRAVLAENGPELQRIFTRIGEAIKAIATVALPILRVAFVEVLPRVLGIAITIIDKTTAAIAGIIKAVKWIGEKAAASVQGLADAFREVYRWINKALGVLQKFTDLLNLGDKSHWWNKGLQDFIGDADPSLHLQAGSGPKSISPALYDELAGARSMGLVLTSGYRPGAKTKHGTTSDHSIYPSHAIDVAGTASNMARFFRWLIGQADVKQAFYDPLGSIFGGVLSGYREGGHSDHVHVATYDKGGWLQPGLTLAANWTGRPERVGGGGDVIINIPNYLGSKNELMSWMQNAAQQFKRQNGRSAF
jgi:hypothetical protein